MYDVDFLLPDYPADVPVCFQGKQRRKWQQGLFDKRFVQLIVVACIEDYLMAMVTEQLYLLLKYRVLTAPI